MKIAVMQPYFFPYIGYWQLISVVDKFVIFDDVNYINKGWINRNRILENGQDAYVNILLEKKSQNKKINEHNCVQDEIWKQDILRRLHNNYFKAPYYDEVMERLSPLIRAPIVNLAQYLENILRNVAQYLELNTEILLSSEIPKNDSLRGQEKIIQICKILGATEYYNAIGGTELYSRERFTKEGMNLFFIKTQDIQYKQFDNNFIPCLSIIDVLMFNGKEKTKEYLKKYEIVLGK